MSWNQSSYLPADVRDERVSSFMGRVYGWMFAGLLVTSLTAFVVANSQAISETIIENRMLFWVVLLAQLGLVFFLSAKVHTLSPGTAAGLFILYSALSGVTASIMLLIYTASSVASTFVITAGMFGATSIFGLTTKKNLAGWGQFFFMGLIGLLLAMIVGFFWHSDALQFVISVIGVLVFTGLTAWDSQRLKQMAVALPDGSVGSYAVVGALSLYLDFINLFFFLLRLSGGRRN